jgi:hypothetical protein
MPRCAARRRLTRRAPPSPRAAASAATSAPSICDYSFTYFPPGRENDNVPEGWTLKKQQKAGNDAPDELLKIALAGYPVPTLQVWPQYFLLNNNTEVPVSCWTPQASAQAFGGTRRLSQTRSNAYVVKPATYKVEYTLMSRNRLAGISPNGSITSPPLSIKLENFGDVVADVSAPAPRRPYQAADRARAPPGLALAAAGVGLGRIARGT